MLPAEIAGMGLGELLRLWVAGDGEEHSWDWEQFCSAGRSAPPSPTHTEKTKYNKRKRRRIQ